MGTGPNGAVGFCMAEQHKSAQMRARTGFMEQESYSADGCMTSSTHKSVIAACVPATRNPALRYTWTLANGQEFDPYRPIHAPTIEKVRKRRGASRPRILEDGRESRHHASCRLSR